MTGPVAADVPAVEVRGLVKRFGLTTVLGDVALRARKGQVTCLMGPSGSGKSTLLRCMAGLERPDGGEVLIEGEALDPALRGSNHKELRSRIGFVFQQFNLWPHMTALGNVSEALKTVRRMPRAAAEALAMQQLAKVGLADHRDQYPAELSGGQQQRVAIARALAINPRIMLFDEPTSSLDPELTGEVLAVIKDLAREGMTMVIVSHEVGLVVSVAQRVAFLDRGRIVLDGAPADVFQQPRHPRLQQFLETYIDRDASRLLA